MTLKVICRLQCFSKCNSTNIRATFRMVLTDTERRAVHRQQPSFLYFTHTHTHTHTRLTALCPGLPRWVGTRMVKPIWILLKQETVSGSGISWAMCKSAPRSRQITTPVPHRSVFAGRMPFLPPNQQRQSTEGHFTVCRNMINRNWPKMAMKTFKAGDNFQCTLIIKVTFWYARV